MYETIVGLEIHSELLTESKMYCSCKNEFGLEPNTNCCPICMGMPGTLPRVNKRAVEFAIRAGLALNCKISQHTRMDRKNYYYPDLVKGYQITQDETPICEGGYIEIETKNGAKKIHLERIHIEEDTGKSTHLGDESLLDYNRCGVPLIEIVTKPEISTSEEARLFMESLRSILKYIGVSDGKMEEGSLRCDVNINVKDLSAGTKTAITEVKNLGSFRAVVRAMEYEKNRHEALLKNRQTGERETRRWDEVNGETIVMRKKVTATDYRYVPESDLLSLFVPKEWIEEIKKSLPELPAAKKERFIKDFSLSAYDAGVLSASKELSEFYEKTLSLTNDAKLTANWISGEVLRILGEQEKDITKLSITPETLAELLYFVKTSEINNNTAKKVLREMSISGKSAKEIIKEQGLSQVSDETAIREVISEVLKENPKSIEDYKNGKDRALGFLIGKVMKQSKGKANPKLVNEFITEMLEQI